MDKESFNQLLELQSCEKKIKEINQQISVEKNRVSTLETNIKNSLESIEDKKNSLSENNGLSKKLELEVAELQSRISRAEQNISNATTQAQVNASENELIKLTPMLEETETQLMSTWEKVELLEEEIEETKDFKKGSAESLESLTNEVNQHCEKLNQQSQLHQNRKLELFNLLGENISAIFKQLEEKKSPAVTFMDKSRCTSCMTQLDQSLIAEINAMRDLCFCPTCGRVLVSLDVRY